MKKRLFAVLLTLCLCLGILPMTAYAEEAPGAESVYALPEEEPVEILLPEEETTEEATVPEQAEEPEAEPEEPAAEPEEAETVLHEEAPLAEEAGAAEQQQPEPAPVALEPEEAVVLEEEAVPAEPEEQSMESEAMLATGWVQDNGQWYYLNSSGEKQNGWVKSGDKWYYLNSAGVMQTGWQKIDGKWYYFSDSGAMQTGWLQLSGVWYYFNGSGAMQTGWQKIGGKWYYLDDSGAMKTGWQKIDGKWYYLDGSGAMKTGWQKIGDKWYYLDGSGAMKTGWLQIDGKWYFLDGSGVMVTGARTIGKYTYFFYEKAETRKKANGLSVRCVEGEMAVNDTCTNASGTYVVDENGYATKANASGWTKQGDDWYYSVNGKLVTDEVRKIGGKYYGFDTTGKMRSNESFSIAEGLSLSFYRAKENGELYTSCWYQEETYFGDGAWYYYGSDAKAYTGYRTVGGKNYFFALYSGQMVVNRNVTDGSYTYFCDENGYATQLKTNGWTQKDGKWYYCDKGALKRYQVVQIGGKYYGFDYNGAMYADTTFQIAMEHYHAKKSGELYTSQWVKENAGWYYYGSDAKAYRNGSYTIGGKSYSFNAIGVCTNP